MYVGPFEGPLSQNPFASIAEPGNGSGSLFSGLGLTDSLGSDGISRLLPPPSGVTGTAQNPLQSGMLGPLAGLMQQLMQMLGAMLGYGSSPFTGGGCPQPCSGPEQYFSNANGSSEGDPHLSFNGHRWTSMQSQPNLLQSDSIPGGFQVSTQVTPPTSQGVTWNQSATVALNGGATTISLNNAGQASISNDGQPVSLAPGQTLQLGYGQSVTCNRNGSLSVTASNGQGGQITTALDATGRGVNVDVSAQNVDLGGSLVDGRAQSQAPVTGLPIASPVGGFPSPSPIGGFPFPSPIGGGLPLPSPIPFVPFTAPIQPSQMNPDGL